ncbi:MAG TPA: DUF5985 family protein [Candidatus Baltobacteraceae bacterium]|jgi:uncharacterized membrane protein HdeD (DUF308 family)
MYLFFNGVVAMGAAVAAAYFAHFWRLTSERLLLLFAIAFGLIAIERIILSVLDFPEQGQPLIYLLRFIAFAIILIAIIDKNRERR